jgi:hypothetical protein
MTQIPYVSDPYGHDPMAEPPRTSLMAIISMVLSLIGCCLPIGFLGAILGIFSLVGISSSRGRVTGKGFAVAGIIIGLVNTAIFVGITIAMDKGFKAYVGITQPVYENLEAGNFNEVRRSLSAVSATTTDEQFRAFRDAYQAELGLFQSLPEGWWALIQDFVDPTVGPNMQTFQGRSDMIPIPGRFDQGLAILLFQFDPSVQSNGPPLFDDLIIVLPSGTQMRLSDYVTTPAAPADATPEAPVEPTQPEEDSDG